MPDPTPAQLRNLLEGLSAELRECPDDILVRLKLAQTLRLLDRPTEAVAFYSSVAWHYAIVGNLPQAISLCKVILELAPDHRETQEMLAKLYASERTRDAKRSFPVRQVQGRWVLDPRSTGDRPAAATAPTGPLYPDELTSPEVPSALHQRVSGSVPDGLARAPSVTAPPEQKASPAGLARAPSVTAPPEQKASPDGLARPAGHLHEQPDGRAPAPQRPERETKPYASVKAPPMPAEMMSTLPPPSSAKPSEVSAPSTGPRPPRGTAAMPEASMNTVLRRDAELAYLHGPKVTECQAAIERHVRAEGSQQDDVPPSPEDQQRVEEELKDTLRDPAFQDTERDVSNAQLPLVPLFSSLDMAAFVALIERLDRRFFSADSIVFSEGEPGDSLMLVSAGHLQVLKQNSEGRLIELARLGPGSFFGEFGLLADQRRHASVRCLDDCELLELRKEVLIELTRDHPSVAETVRAFYQQRVLDMVMATSPLFRPLAPEDYDRVVSRFTPRRFKPGEVIIEEGGPSCFYVVLIGELEVTCKAGSGEEIVVGTLTEGDYFGEMSLISGCEAEATVRATRATETLALDGRDFYELASIHPELWAEVQRECRNRHRINEELLSAWKAGALLL